MIRVLLLVLALCASIAQAATCPVCIPGLSPTTGARGIKVPADCVCDWEDTVNENWGLLNTTYQAPDLVCSLCVAASDIAADAVTPDKVLTAGQTDTYLLAYESTGDTWTWVDPSTLSAALSDGDKGDVVVSSSGTVLTVEDVSGGTAAGARTVIAGSTHVSRDASTGLWTGTGVQVGQTNAPEVTYLTEGAGTMAGIWVPLILNGPGDTWTINDATCTNIGGEDATWCRAENDPHSCCTAAGTGLCGYCSGTGVGVPVPCGNGAGGDDAAGASQCSAAVQYFSQWWHDIDYAGTPNVFESFAVGTFVPRLMVSGGGTKNLGHTAMFDYNPNYYVRDNSTNLIMATAAGPFLGFIFSHEAGAAETGAVTNIMGFRSAAALSAQWTATNYTGLLVDNVSGAGVLTNAYGVNVADLTKAGTLAVAFNTAMTASGSVRYALRSTGSAPSVHAGAARFGDSDTIPTATVEAQREGTIGSSIVLYGAGVGDLTVGASGEVDAYSFAPTLTMSASPSSFGLGAGFRYAPIVKNAASTTITAIAPFGFEYTPTFRADNAALTINDFGTFPSATGLAHFPTFDRTGSPTQTIASVAGLWSSGSIGAGWTVTAWDAVKILSPGVSGTLTTLTGLNIGALSGGTNNFPIKMTEHTIAGTVPAGSGVLGVQTRTPNRLYFANDAGQYWYSGMSTWTGGVGKTNFNGTESNQLLAGDNTTVFFQAYNLSAPDAEAEIQQNVPGAFTVYGIHCGVLFSPNFGGGGGTQTRTFTLRATAASTALACTISENETSCFDREEAGVAFVATDSIDYMSTATNTPFTSSVTCVTFFTMDAF